MQLLAKKQTYALRTTHRNKIINLSHVEKHFKKRFGKFYGYQFADDSRLRTNAWAIATSGEPVGTPGNGPDDAAISMWV